MFRFFQTSLSDDKDRSSQYNELSQDSTQNLRKRSKPLITGFSGIWSSFIPDCISPPPRKDCFSIYSAQHNGVFIGYGIGEDNQFFNDCWFLSFENYTWTKIKLTNEVSPRTGSRGIIYQNNLIIFGGFSKNIYYDDLHIINISTGQVTPLATTGPMPTPRCTPIVSFYNNKMYVWGGFNVNVWPTELYSLDLSTLQWTMYPQSITGRTSVPSVTVGSKVYIYGCSKSNALLIIDMANNIVITEKITGSPPISTLRSAQMVGFQKYLFFIGGKTAETDKYMLLYALDLERNWWFVFHVKPDGETTSFEDGLLSETGLFFMNRIIACAAAFDEKNRQIVTTLGAPFENPPSINVIKVGEALGVLHMRDDMLAQLKL